MHKNNGNFNAESVFALLKKCLAAAGIATPMGAYLILSYLLANKIPVPIDSGSMVFFLPLIAVAGFVVIFMGILFLFLPGFFIKGINLNFRPLYYPPHFGKLHAPIFSYFILHGITAIVLIFLGYLEWVIQVDLLTTIQVILVLFSVSLMGIIYIIRNFYGWDILQWYLLTAVLNVLFFVWAMTFIAIFGPRIALALPGYDSWVFLGLSVVLLVFHAVQTIPLAASKPESNAGFRITKGFLGLACAAFFIPEVAIFMGGATLHLFGIGGDKNVSITFCKGELALPQEIIDAEGSYRLALAMPSSWYIKVNSEAKATQIEVKYLRRVEFKSKNDSVEFVKLFSPHDANCDSKEKDD